jgi:uncharacterized membrane protein YeaQ/YmgE (transglycosylase-associated protein family)
VAIYFNGIFLTAGDEMGYCILDFYIIMPLTTLIISIIMTAKRAYLFWLYPIVFGILGILIPYLVFGTFDIISIFFAFVPALIGRAVVSFVKVLH